MASKYRGGCCRLNRYGTRWYAQDIATAAVMAVEPGLGIDVDDSKPAEPVVSIDRDEVDKWYEPLSAQREQHSTKTLAQPVARLPRDPCDLDYADINHDHDGVYQPAGTYDNLSLEIGQQRRLGST